MSSIATHILSATLVHSTGSAALNIVDGTLTLDEDYSPYVRADLTCSVSSPDLLDLLDPRDSVRVTVTANSTWMSDNPRAPITRTFDLGLRERSKVAEDGTVTLRLGSDEGLLQDRALISTSPERIYGLSVKNAVQFTLSKIGASLDTEDFTPEDANVEANEFEPTLTNLVPNPSFEVNASGWSSSNFTATSVNTFAVSGAKCGRLVVLSSAPATGFNTDYISVSPDIPYTFSISARSTTSTPEMQVEVRWFTSANAIIATDPGDTKTVFSDGWTRLTTTKRAPATAAKAWLIVRWTSAVVAGQVFYLDAALITPSGNDDMPYFDGSTSSGLYADAWAGAAHNSASTRTWIPNADIMVLDPGVSLWDYIEPIVLSVGLRLFCDEQRRWRLVAPLGISEGQLNIAATQNLTRGTDTISLLSGEWYDSVVIRYQWDDAEGVSLSAYDAAGGPGTRARFITLDRPFPGPGLAATLLAAAAGRGRVLDLSSTIDLAATPGQTLVASLPDTIPQTGLISSVTWSFPSNEMSVRSRALIDTPATAWLLVPEGRKWTNIATGIDWTEYTP